MNLDADRFLEDQSGRYAVEFARAISDLMAHEVAKNRTAAREAEKRLADIIRNTMGMAEILGARLMLREAAKIIASERMSTQSGDMFSFIQSSMF